MKNLVAFISCVNNEKLYTKCLQYIKQLTLPEGYSYEIIAIRGAKGLASGYNQAMNQSQAKYKVYLHQDTFIINKNFILDILNIFRKYAQIGLMGMIGAETMPASGIWSGSKSKYGKVLENSLSSTNEIAPFPSNDFSDEYKLVKAVDGLIMITQYDIYWRDDIFDGWDFYDIAQCMEFYRHGYQVCVPKQDDFWCIHDCGKVNLKNYDKYRRLFLEEYSSDLFIFGRLTPVLHDWNKYLRPHQRKVEHFFKKLFRRNE